MYDCGRILGGGPGARILAVGFGTGGNGSRVVGSACGGGGRGLGLTRATLREIGGSFFRRVGERMGDAGWYASFRNGIRATATYLRDMDPQCEC